MGDYRAPGMPVRDGQRQGTTARDDSEGRQRGAAASEDADGDTRKESLLPNIPDIRNLREYSKYSEYLPSHITGSPGSSFPVF